MKKILSLLTSGILITSTSVIVVVCSSDNTG